MPVPSWMAIKTTVRLRPRCSVPKAWPMDSPAINARPEFGVAHFACADLGAFDKLLHEHGLAVCTHIDVPVADHVVHREDHAAFRTYGCSGTGKVHFQSISPVTPDVTPENLPSPFCHKRLAEANNFASFPW